MIKVMENLIKNPNARRSCTVDGLLGLINRMDEGLEKIQKSLDQYLETKRMVFPRFYFVSDDDLLEILGQSKDPIAVQKHVKKCFEGFVIYTLFFILHLKELFQFILGLKI